MSHAVFQFREFVIDPAARELWQASQRIALPPKSFECLAYLLENRERAVGRDELENGVALQAGLQIDFADPAAREIAAAADERHRGSHERRLCGCDFWSAGQGRKQLSGGERPR
jgi:hypothetical protein